MLRCYILGEREISEAVRTTTSSICKREYSKGAQVKDLYRILLLIAVCCRSTYVVVRYACI